MPLTPKTGSPSPRMRRCSSTASTSSLRSQYSLMTDPEEVAGRLKMVHEGGRVGVEAFADDASFENPVLKVVKDARVVMLLYNLLHVLCSEIHYDVKSCFGGRNDVILVEANVTYTWCRPVRVLLRPLSFHLYHSVAIDELVTGEHAAWKFSSITEVWDFNAISIGAHLVTSPFIRAAGVACLIVEWLLFYVALMKIVAF